MTTASPYLTHRLSTGLTLLAEPMPHMKSAAMTLLLPAGVSSDPAGAVGISPILSDLLLRGAGKRDARQLSEYLDTLGLQRSSSTGIYHLRFGAAALADNLLQCLDAYGDILTRPHLPQDGFDSAKDSALQSLSGLDDDPRSKLSVLLRRAYFGDPLGRNTMGDVGDLKELTLEKVKAHYARRCTGDGAILAVAGNIDPAAFIERAAGAFSGLASTPAPLAMSSAARTSYQFEKQPSEQTHIGLAYPSIGEAHPDYYANRLAIEALGGGMSSRLFTEVREKRALCYSVSASYVSIKAEACIFAYAGTSNDRAQATLDCLMAELRRLAKGLAPGELERAKIGLKAAVIMQGESTSARAGALAGDYFALGRIRTLDEISAAIDAVTLEQVNSHLAGQPAGPFTVVVLGPNELKLN